jgi:hypothetical protein
MTLTESEGIKMKLNFQHDKEVLVSLVDEFLQKTIIGQRAELIINGEKTVGVIEKVMFAGDDSSTLVFWVDGHERKIPFFEDTKSRMGKELITFETRNHTTVLEIV